MSDLQCPARIILAVDGDVDRTVEAASGERVSAVWSSTASAAHGTAERVAGTLRLSLQPDERLDEVAEAEPEAAAVERVSRLVQEVSDLGRGETSLLIGDAGLIALAVRRLCGTVTAAEVTAHPLPPGGTVLVEVDSSGWSCSGWPTE